MLYQEELKAELMRLFPIGWEELWAKVVAHRNDYFDAIIERARQALREDGFRSEEKRSEPLTLNDLSRTVSWHGVSVRLTRTEYRLVSRLADCKGEWVPRSQLYRDVWRWQDEGEVGVSELIRSYLRNIRQAFRSHGWPELIVTSRQGFYRLAVAPSQLNTVPWHS